MISGILSDTRTKMDKALDALKKELAGLRTGRASISVLDHVLVDSYGSQMPIRQLATLSVPEPRLIVIQPWDASQINSIEKAIMTSDLGLTPSNDGKVIRLNLPQLTEERRKELVKVARKYGEECKVSIRNTRRDANEAARKLEKDKGMSQDDLKKAQADIQTVTDKEIKRVDELVSRKEAEIMEV